MKKALITGGSSGIGKETAFYLDSLGFKLILVGRKKEKLEKVKNKLKDASIICCDLSKEKEVLSLYEKTKNENISLLINNAAFGLFGFFKDTDLKTELDMIHLNIKGYHILTKLFLKDFIKKDRGYILNVSSSAGFLSGPYLSTYYATKNYITALTLAIYEELRIKKSNVKISLLTPGPVNTNFNNVAGGSFNIKGLDPKYVAKYAVDQTLKGKLIIMPTTKMKIAIFFSRFMPRKILLKINYQIQKRKTNGLQHK